MNGLFNHLNLGKEGLNSFELVWFTAGASIGLCCGPVAVKDQRYSGNELVFCHLEHRLVSFAFKNNSNLHI